MKKEDLVKFNLTSNMSLELIKFNQLKKELNKLKKDYNNDNTKNVQLKIQKLEQQLIDTRNKFIYEFRMSNKEEIIKYLKIKDQI